MYDLDGMFSAGKYGRLGVRDCQLVIAVCKLLCRSFPKLCMVQRICKRVWEMGDLPLKTVCRVADAVTLDHPLKITYQSAVCQPVFSFGSGLVPAFVSGLVSDTLDCQ